MNPNKALWEKGNFTEIAALMRESGEVVVKSLGMKPPLRALDLGCGDGTTALPLARSTASWWSWPTRRTGTARAAPRSPRPSCA